jgi:hypothetical protein
VPLPHTDRALIIAAALCLFAVGCTAPAADPPARLAMIAAPYPPPPKRAEIPPPAPAADVLWLGGHWRWDSGKYVWVPGQYALRPTPTANWLPGYWDRDDAGWLWTEGRWQS